MSDGDPASVEALKRMEVCAFFAHYNIKKKHTKKQNNGKRRV